MISTLVTDLLWGTLIQDFLVRGFAKEKNNIINLIEPCLNLLTFQFTNSMTHIDEINPFSSKLMTLTLRGGL